MKTPTNAKKDDQIREILEKLFHDIEEEDIGISLFTTFYQNYNDLSFFSERDRNRVLAILKKFSEDSKRHKITLEKIIFNLGGNTLKNEYLKTLWMLRFEKIKQNEEQAAWGYQEILDQLLIDLGSDDETVQLLTELVRDERAHAHLAEELIRICHRNHPEVNPLNVEDDCGDSPFA